MCRIASQYGLMKFVVLTYIITLFSYTGYKMSLEIIPIIQLGIRAVSAYFGQKKTAEINRYNTLTLQILQFEKYKLMDSRMNLLRCSQRHWDDAMMASSSESRSISLQHVNQYYVQLIDLPQNESLPGDDQSYDNTPLISAGYWGRFNYFGLLNDYNNSLRQVYECAVRYPSIATKIFDSSFFPKFDVSEFRDLCNDLDSLNECGHIKTKSSIYARLPIIQASALIKLQIEEFQSKCKDILNSLKYLK